MSKMISRIVALAAVVALQTAVHAAGGYNFTKLVDHVDGNFSPRSFTCASINETGDVAFKASRSAPDGLSSWDVIARVSRAGVITTIVEDPDKTQFQFFGNFVSINDSGQTSFGAFLSNDDLEIIRADAGSRVTIASTAGAFDSFGFDTQLDNSGEVAFTGQLDDGNRGLFSGDGGPVTTHYLDTTPVRVDGVTTDLFGGNFGRPAINNTGGELAFFDFVDPTSARASSRDAAASSGRWAPWSRTVSTAIRTSTISASARSKRRSSTTQVSSSPRSSRATRA